MLVDSFVLPGDDAYPCHLTAKRYRPTAYVDDAKLTLVLAHGLGMHKETWEPILEDLFSAKGSASILEAWAIDAPNHGEAAVLNRIWLANNWAESIPWDMYQAGLGRFLQVAPKKVPGVPVFKEISSLVALGHSAGATGLAWIHADPAYDIQFSSLILLELMATPPPVNLAPFWHAASNMMYARKDCWPSKELAYNELKETPGYGKGWDARSLKVYVEHNITLHPSSKYATNPWSGVVLATPKEQEAACCRAGQLPPQKIVQYLPAIAEGTATHLIWAEQPVKILKGVQAAVNTLLKGKTASIQWIPNAGHAVCQERPKKVAGAVLKCIEHSIKLEQAAKL